MEIIKRLKLSTGYYYSSDDLFIHCPIYCKGSKNSRELVRNKNITDFKYLRQKDSKWCVSDGKSVKFDKIFIKENIINLIPELNNDKTLDGAEEAPQLIYLKEEEKFKDNNGNALDIETRGERKHNKIYFKVKDISEQFNIPNLYITIVSKTSGYETEIHYKYFTINSINNVYSKSSKKDIKVIKEMYLTYEGLLRVLFTTRNNKTSNFINWTVNTLFTVQMGSDSDKNKLISSIKGVSYESIQELFSCNARSLPCVYLTAFNTVGKLRNVMNIDNSFSDDSIVYKFGLTKSFETRKNGHKNEYKELGDNIDMKLVKYTYIDPLYLTDAENEIKDKLSDYKFNWKTYDELVIMPKSMSKYIDMVYENIGSKYSGHTAEFNKQVSELNQQISDLKHTIELKDIRHNHLIELHNKEIDNYKKDIENKDLLLKVKELENKLLTK
jgi:hypothetical protein